MVQVLEQDTLPDVVEATLNYIVDTGEKIFTETAAPGSTDVRSGGRQDPRRITIRNGRQFADKFVLEQNGFHFVRHDTKVEDFFNEEEIRRVYYSEMEALVKAEIGASRVVVFDQWSAPQRVRDLLPQEADGLLRRRFAIVQVWRPIRNPVETFPLAICDARTLSEDDLIVSERRYPNRVGQTYAITYNPAHRWYWFPRMRRDEALVFKVYDSLRDGRARWTAHTAFDDPSSPRNARPRESIEIRTLAFF
jgi:hypothetical protein